MKNTHTHTHTHLYIYIYIRHGVNSILELMPAALFYSLSASHVLITNQEQCKLAGFATSTAVNQPEKLEEQDHLPPPIRWLSPEAIKLNHMKESDIWSFGVFLWEITNGGEIPLDDKTEVEARKFILTGYRLSKPVNCTDELEIFIFLLIFIIYIYIYIYSLYVHYIYVCVCVSVCLKVCKLE
ncbi:hypothetical protein LSH36_380g02002 [Paralvinella palmiformis]|uniref:Protein kinase domain-containing protein n=1 Tax=Paralvinella palmiformis TaxID=53620 RepID=A0AAD9N0I7_9ANNE|nr:hypothetical protein LSH36_380g02002 [Paralvinella palmiformis]